MTLMAFEKVSVGLRATSAKPHYIWSMREIVAVARGIMLVWWSYPAHAHVL